MKNRTLVMWFDAYLKGNHKLFKAFGATLREYDKEENIYSKK